MFFVVHLKHEAKYCFQTWQKTTLGFVRPFLRQYTSKKTKYEVVIPILLWINDSWEPKNVDMARVAIIKNVQTHEHISYCSIFESDWGPKTLLYTFN